MNTKSNQDGQRLKLFARVGGCSAAKCKSLAHQHNQQTGRGGCCDRVNAPAIESRVSAQRRSRLVVASYSCWGFAFFSDGVFALHRRMNTSRDSRGFTKGKANEEKACQNLQSSELERLLGNVSVSEAGRLVRRFEWLECVQHSSHIHWERERERTPVACFGSALAHVGHSNLLRPSRCRVLNTSKDWYFYHNFLKIKINLTTII